MKDEADGVVDGLVIFNGTNAATDYTSNKQINTDAVNATIIYGNAASNSDMFNETSSVPSVVGSAINNNIESRSPRKRKSKSVPKQKKTKTPESVHENFTVFQLPSSIQNPESIVTAMPVGINRILPKSEKVDGGVSVAVADEQYQIFLLQA